MAEYKQVVKIFVSTPSDVPEEKESLSRIISDIEREWGDELKVTLQVLDWRSVAPGMGRAEDVILEQLPVNEWDIYVGILRNRFGTPTGKHDVVSGKDLLSGTEEEFLLAYRAWLEMGRPHIMFYRCTRPPQSNDDIDPEQLISVRQFFANFDSTKGSNPGLIVTYSSVDEFRHHVRHDIVSTLRRYFRPKQQEVAGILGAVPVETSLYEGRELLRRLDDKGIVIVLSERQIALPPGLLTDQRHDIPSRSDQGLSIPSLSMAVSERVRGRLQPEEPPEQLIGREDFIRDIRESVLRGTLPYLIYGMPGAGKSAVLAKLAHDPVIYERFAEPNIFWVDLRGIRALTEGAISNDLKGQIADEIENEIADQIARALNYVGVLSETRPRQKLRALGDALVRDRPHHLLIIDNADHDVHLEVIKGLIRYVTRSILVASRSRFLAALIPDNKELPVLLPDDAAELFCKQARLSLPPDEACTRICNLLGNHPQAILLAAPAIWLDGLSLAELEDNLKRNRVQALDRGAREEELNIQTSFGLSYGELARDDERYMFDACGAFAPSGFVLGEMAEITARPLAECRQILAGLRNRSLVVQDERNADRYSMHPLLHAFARDKLVQSQKGMLDHGTALTDTPVGKFIMFYTHIAQEHEEDYPALEASHDNLLVAAEWAWQFSAWNYVHSLWEALDAWLEVTGEWSSMSIYQDRAVHANRQLSHRDQQLAKALNARASYRELVGRTGEALADAEESLTLARKIDDPKAIVSALTSVAELYQLHMNRRDDGHAKLEEAWDICHKVPGWIEAAYVAYQLARSWWERGGSEELRTAHEWFEKCISLAGAAEASQLQKNRYEAYALTSIGNLFVQQQDYDKGREYLERSLELKRRIGNKYSIAISLSSLADLEQRQDHYERALDLQINALELYREIGATRAVLDTLCDIGTMYHSLGDMDRAQTYYKAAKAVGDQIEAPLDSARVLLQLAQLYASIGEYAAALDAYEERLELIQALPEKDPFRLGVTLREMGDIYEALGERDKARGLFEKSRDSLAESENKVELATTLGRLGLLIASQGDLDSAISILETRLHLVQSLSTRDLDLLGNSWTYLGRVYRKARKLELAEHSLVEARTLFIEGNNKASLLEVLKALVEVYSDLDVVDKVNSVRSEIDALLAKAKEQGMQSNNPKDALGLAEVLLTAGDTDGARLLVGHAHDCLINMNTADQVYQRRQLATSYYTLGLANRGKFGNAVTLELWHKALDLFEQVHDDHAQRVVLQNIGTAYEELDDTEQALIFLKRARSLGTPDGDREHLSLLLTIAELSRSIGNQGEMAEAILEARQLMVQNQDRRPYSIDPEFLLLVARFHTQVEQLVDAQTALTTAGIIADAGYSESVTRGLARAYDQLGRAYERRRDYQGALDAYQQALQRLVAEQDMHYYGVVLHDIGDAYRGLGQLQEARNYYQQALHYKQRAVVEHPDADDAMRSLATTMDTLSHIYVDLKDFAEAEATIQEAIRLRGDVLEVGRSRGRTSTRDQNNLAAALRLGAEMLMITGEREAAISLLERAADLYKLGGDSSLLAYFQTLRLLASAYDSAGLEAKMAETRMNLQTLLHDLTEYGERTSDIEILILAADLFAEEDQVADAESILGLVVEFSREDTTQLGTIPFVPQLAAAYHRLGRAYERRRDYQGALDAYQQALQRLVAEQDMPYYGVVLHDIGDAYRGLGQLQEARNYYQQALHYKQRTVVEHPDADDAMRSLATTMETLSHIYVDLKDFAEAEATIQEAIRLWEARALGGKLREPEDGQRLITLLAWQSQALMGAGNASSAVDVLNRAYKLVFGPAVSVTRSDSSSLAAELHMLSQVYKQLHKYVGGSGMPDPSEELEKLIKEAAETKNVNTLLAVSSYYAEVDSPTEAEDVLRHVVSLIDEMAQKPDYSDIKQLPRAYDQLGRAYERRRDYQGALDAYQQALQRLVAEQDMPYYGVVLHDIGDAYRGLGQLQEARNYYQQAELAKAKASNVRDRVTTLLALASLQQTIAEPLETVDPEKWKVELQLGAGYANQAVTLLEEQRAVERVADREANIRLARALAINAQIVSDANDYDKALTLYERAYALYPSSEQAPETLQEWSSLSLLLAEAYRQVGRDVEADKVIEELAKVLPSPDPNDPQALLSVGIFFLEQKDLDKARAQFDKVGGLLASNRPHQQDNTLRGPLVAAYHRLGRQYEAQKLYSDALTAYQSSVAHLELTDDRSAYGVVLHDIADVYRAQGHIAEAREMYQKAIQAKSLETDVESHVQSIQALANMEAKQGEIDEALRLCSEGISLLQTAATQANTQQLMRLLALAGQMYILKNDNILAVRYIKRAQDLAESDPTISASERQSIAKLRVRATAGIKGAPSTKPLPDHIAEISSDKQKPASNKSLRQEGVALPAGERNTVDTRASTEKSAGVPPSQAIMIGTIVAMAIIITWLVIAYVIR
ncbi:MAG: tetratricopeptide repeat protein [Ktedonobacterales bacterium]